MRNLFLLCLLALVAGCTSGRYYYQPAEQATAFSAGHPSAHYVIPPPPATKEGDVRVTSFGITEVDLNDDRNPVEALHVRLIIANESGSQAWTLNTRQTQVELPGARRAIAPTYVNANDTTVPSVRIPPGASRTVDLYYTLPSGFEDEDEVPRFDVIWRLQTDEQWVVERTPFERREIERPRQNVVYSWGVGTYPYWWYDPWYPRPIIIERARPRVYYYGQPR